MPELKDCIIDDNDFIDEGKTNKDDRLQLLSLLEKKTLPLAFLRQEVPYEELFADFSKVMEKLMGADVFRLYPEEGFFLTKHSVVHKEGKPYYVAVGNFPFEETEPYAGMAKRFYVVLSEGLEYSHCFLELLKYKKKYEAMVPVYEICYVNLEEDKLVYYYAGSYDFHPDKFESKTWDLNESESGLPPVPDKKTIEERIADECSFWAWCIENGGEVWNFSIR